MSVSRFSNRAFHEMRAQWAYQSRLAQHVGFANALRMRALGFVERRPGHRAEIAIQPPGLRHPVRLRVASTDPETYHQVLVEEQYGPLLDLRPEVIVDCGANAGFTSAYFLSRLPRARVVALEPFPDNAALCRRNLAPYGDRAELREAAVWSHACRLVLDGHGGHEWGVQVRPARAGEEGGVAALGIADLGLPRIDLLKIDIEGSEEPLFSEGAEAWLPTVGAIAVELHGPACEAAFRRALEPYEGEWSTAGELVIVRGLRPRRRVGAEGPRTAVETV